MALIMFSVGLAYLIHWNGSGLDLHWAFLVVFVLYLLIAALLGYVGYRKVRKVGRAREGHRRGPEDQGRAHQPRRTSQRSPGCRPRPVAGDAARRGLRDLLAVSA